MAQTVLITGATGKQGGAAVKQLLSSSNSFSIRALVRDPSSGSSKKLESKGVSLYKGNLTDLESLKSALNGVQSAFMMTTPADGEEKEVEQGKTFIDAAKAVGTVKYIVFTSVEGADRKTNVPHFDSKGVIEKYLKNSGIAYTILRPTAFMENFPMEGVGRFISLGMFQTLTTGKKVQMIAVEDIGKIAAKALMDEDKYKGREIGLAGDDISPNEQVDRYEKVQGVRPWRAWIPMFVFRAMLPHDFWMMFKFFREAGYQVNIAELRDEFPELQTFEDYVRINSKSKTA